MLHSTCCDSLIDCCGLVTEKICDIVIADKVCDSDMQLLQARVCRKPLPYKLINKLVTSSRYCMKSGICPFSAFQIVWFLQCKPH